MAMECGSLPTAPSSSLDDLFATQSTEVDVGMEWLSIFVEDCFSSRGNCLPAPKPNQPTSTTSKPSHHPHKPQTSLSSLHQFAVAGKARSKRKRIAAANGSRTSFTSWTLQNPLAQPPLHYLPSSDPPLLDQTYWLADSELIGPKRGLEQEQELEQQQQQQQDQQQPGKAKKVIMMKAKVSMSEGARRCSHCLSQRTPQWRAGPMGPKTLCNACGVRYKSGRLLPEYRPAKSPTFVSNLHSNSHKKVLEMRMGTESGIGIGIGMGMGMGNGMDGGGDGGMVSSSIPAVE